MNRPAKPTITLNGSAKNILKQNCLTLIRIASVFIVSKHLPQEDICDVSYLAYARRSACCSICYVMPDKSGLPCRTVYRQQCICIRAIGLRAAVGPCASTSVNKMSAQRGEPQPVRKKGWRSLALRIHVARELARDCRLAGRGPVVVDPRCSERALLNGAQPALSRREGQTPPAEPRDRMPSEEIRSGRKLAGLLADDGEDTDIAW